ncbi:MAG: rhamnose ABC transporter substrate-binding protein [Chloroflexi bacterium]|nr:rhamnose ABC transporter substrate-binding protein [Chloroflexota bacterium]
MNKLRFLILVTVILAVILPGVSAQDGDPIVAEPGQELNMVLLPKTLGNAVFDQAHEGAMEAHEELENPGELIFNAPTPDNAIPGQIEIIESAITQEVDAIMISANDYEQLLPSTQSAMEAGITVVTWDSPVAPEGEALFIAQVDFDETGQVMADMALSILGEEGGEFAILSATPDASNQNAWIEALQTVLEEDDTYEALELVDIVYGNDDPDDSYNEALGLIDSYPDLQLIMAPTTVGIAAAAKAMFDEGLCSEIAVSGLGLPAEMQEFTELGCAPQFALWSFTDLGYLTYYVTYLLATGAMEAEEGVTFEAGRMGTYTIEADPTREDALRVLMGPFSVYTEENIDEWAMDEEEMDEEEGEGDEEGEMEEEATEESDAG